MGNFSLFGSSSSSDGGLYSLLSEYNNIKNGSYYKVVKAYYAKQSNKTSDTKDSKSKNNTSTEQNKLTVAKNDAQAMTTAADALITKGSKSLFNEKDITTKNEDGTETTVKGYDTDAIYKAVKKFADSYNSLLDSASSTDSKNILNSTLNMTNNTKSYEKLLNKVGITIGTNNKLSVDETAFKKADMSTVKTLFNGNSSFAYSVSTKASMINISASSEANKASMYNSRGGYNKNYSTGSMLNSYF